MYPLSDTYIENYHHKNLCKQMEYRLFGKTNMKLSKISLGGAALTKIYSGFDEKEAIATVIEGIKSGINYIDTAYWYGQGSSEMLLGKALRHIPRQAFYIGTKIGRYEVEIDKMFDFSATMTRKSFERSLKLLNLDYVDIIQIHDIEFAPNLDIILNETLPELERFVAEGKAKYIGVTSYSLSKLKEMILAAPGRFDSVLCYTRYTLADDALVEYLPFFQSQNLGIICASCIGMGLLSNSGPPTWHPAPDELKEISRKAATICKLNDIELGKLAMYYSMQIKEPATFLVGIQNRDLLTINLTLFLNGLTIKEKEVLKDLKEKLFTKSWNWEGLEVSNYWKNIKNLPKDTNKDILNK